MQFWIIIITLIVIPFGMMILAEEMNGKGGEGFLVGLMLDAVILMTAFALTDKPTGNFSPPLTNLIVEKGEFSAMIHVKDDDGRVTDSLRITDAAELNAFNKGEFQIKKPERRNWWSESYYDGPEFIVFRPEKP